MQALVTGANGHLGYNLVQALLAAGHRVRASVRNLADPSKTDRVRALGDVELVEVQLHRPDQLRAAMDGVEVLFHAAAEFTVVANGRESEIIDASIKGAGAALRAAADAGVKKVVMTSSTVTLPLTQRGAPPVDESHWNDDFALPYFRAKAEGERLAWQLAGELRLNLVTVLPGGIIGPGFVRNTPTINLIEAIMCGAVRLAVPNLNYLLVDARDVAIAHLLAAERDCDGRFIITNDTTPTLRELVEALHAIDPSIGLPLMDMPDVLLGAMPLFDWLNALLLGAPRVANREAMSTMRGKISNVSTRRSKEVLGWRQTISQEQSLRETMAVISSRR